MAQHANSPSQKAFRENFASLVDGVSVDLDRIATEAYKKNLITRNTLQVATHPSTSESSRAMKLISAIQQHDKLCEESFDIFVSILRDEPVMAKLADALEKSLLQAQDRESTANVCQTTQDGTSSSGTSTVTAPGSEQASAERLLAPQLLTFCVSTSSGEEEMSLRGMTFSDPSAHNRGHLNKVSHLKSQRVQLGRKLVEANKSLEQKDREKREVETQLRNKEKEFQRVTEQKNRRILSLQNEIAVKRKEIDEYQEQIASLERDSTEAKEQSEATMKRYEDDLKRLEESLKEKLMQERLMHADTACKQQLWDCEREKYSLRLQLAEKNIEIEKMKTALAEQRIADLEDQLAKITNTVEQERAQTAIAEQRISALERQLAGITEAVESRSSCCCGLFCRRRRRTNPQRASRNADAAAGGESAV